MKLSIKKIIFLFKKIKDDIKDEFIGFTKGHRLEDLNGLCVYRGKNGGRYFMRNGKGRYCRKDEEIILATLLVSF